MVEPENSREREDVDSDEEEDSDGEEASVNFNPEDYLVEYKEGFSRETLWLPHEDHKNENDVKRKQDSE